MQLPPSHKFPRNPPAPSSHFSSLCLTSNSPHFHLSIKCTHLSIATNKRKNNRNPLHHLHIYLSFPCLLQLTSHIYMATSSASLSKPSKWFSSNTFKLTTIHRPHRSKPTLPTPPTSPPSLSSRRTDDFREAFHRFDANGDGKISSDELKSFLASAGEEVASEEAERVIGAVDSDGDGLMDYGDFVRLMEKDGSGGDDGDLRRAFEMFEVEKGSGCITPKGLQRVLSRLGDVRSNEECAAMIRAYDLDGNGVLDYHEFHCMMT